MSDKPVPSLHHVQKDTHRARDHFRLLPANLFREAIPERPPLMHGSVLWKADLIEKCPGTGVFPIRLNPPLNV